MIVRHFVRHGNLKELKSDKLLRCGSNAGLARNTLTDAAKWNHNGSIMDGEYRAHNVDTEEYS
jgi:hypothetical protein